MPVVEVPAMVAVPLPLSTKVIPVGSAPLTDSAGTGAPVVTTVVLKGAPTIALADEALTMVGARFSVKVSGVLPTEVQAERVPP